MEVAKLLGNNKRGKESKQPENEMHELEKQNHYNAKSALSLV
jgi:hypothetical protein